ncbi:hypothetical protein Q2333_24870, partial [Escherichia coli]|nr:hypothetical protein [Escherichia coli]
MTNWQNKIFFCRIEGVPLYPWSKDKFTPQVTEKPIGELETSLMNLGLIERDYSEAELSRHGLSPY